MDIPVVEELITLDQLYNAYEVFITRTATEIVGVRMIDFRKVGAEMVGPITRSIYESY